MSLIKYVAHKFVPQSQNSIHLLMKAGNIFTISSNALPICQPVGKSLFMPRLPAFCIIFVLFHLRALPCLRASAEEKFIDVINCYLLKSCALCFSTWLARRHRRSSPAAQQRSCTTQPPFRSPLNTVLCCTRFYVHLIDRTTTPKAPMPYVSRSIYLRDTRTNDNNNGSRQTNRATRLGDALQADLCRYKQTLLARYRKLMHKI